VKMPAHPAAVEGEDRRGCSYAIVKLELPLGVGGGHCLGRLSRFLEPVAALRSLVRIQQGPLRRCCPRPTCRPGELFAGLPARRPHLHTDRLSLRHHVWPLLNRYRQLRDREPLLAADHEGQRFYYPTRSEIGALIAGGKRWDGMLRDIARELIGDERGLIVDVGANIGASVLELREGAPNARFVCLEPSARFRRVLLRNVHANRWPATVLPYAAGATEERRTLYFNATTASIAAAAYGERPPLGAQRVTVRTLDGLLIGERRVDLLKIDTDGYELDVLHGAEQTIWEHQPALFFEYDPGLLAWAGHQPDALLRLLGSRGYQRFVAFAPGGGQLGSLELSELGEAARTHGHLNVFARV
jgi:FkbM family methyltransferase